MESMAIIDDYNITNVYRAGKFGAPVVYFDYMLHQVKDKESCARKYRILH